MWKTNTNDLKQLLVNSESIESLDYKYRNFYQNLLNRAKREHIILDESENAIFDLAKQKGIEFFESTADYSEKDATRAFLLGFGKWIWQYGTERNISIRRMWYLQFKQFAQRLWLAKYNAKGPQKTAFNKKYAALLSTTLWDMIKNNKQLSYATFSIKDISRMMFKQHQRGFPNIFLFGEKDSTTPYFEQTCKILGINSLYSGGGKPSAAATEKILDDHIFYKFQCPECKQLINDLPTDKTVCPECFEDLIRLPILLLTLTDWDEDGIRGVESGIVQQLDICAKRKGYTFIHNRIGINPDDLAEEDKTPLEKCFILPKQPTESSIGENVLNDILGMLEVGETQKTIVEELEVSKTTVAKIVKAYKNDVEREEILSEFCSWALAHGIPFDDPDTGKRIYLGIELEALSVDYFYSKIYESIKKIYNISLMSDWARTKHTPSDSDYEDTVEEFVVEILKENKEYQILEKHKKLLIKHLREIDEKQREIIEPIKDELWIKAEEMILLPEWDDRQRKWSEDQWSDESIRVTSDVHDDLIQESVEDQEDFSSDYETLKFRYKQLTKKLTEKLLELKDNNEFNFDFERLTEQLPAENLTFYTNDLLHAVEKILEFFSEETLRSVLTNEEYTYFYKFGYTSPVALNENTVSEDFTDIDLDNDDFDD